MNKYNINVLSSKNQSLLFNKEYFLIKKYNCATSSDKTNIIGITDDEEVAKSMQSVFCGYEIIKFTKNISIKKERKLKLNKLNNLI